MSSISQAQPVAQWLVALAAFILLDWATYNTTLAPLGITPWNPSIGLGVAMVLVGGMHFAPLLAVAPLVSDLFVRALPFDWRITALEATLVGLGYGLGLAYLTRRDLRFDRRLYHLRDMLLLGSIMGLCAGLVATAYVTVLVLSGYLEASRLAESIVRYWIGDIIGLMVMTPFLLLMAYRREFPEVTLTVILQSGAILAAVLLVVGVAGRPRLQLSFLLLLPIIWLALRSGFEGVAAGLLLMQVCIMVLLHLSGGAMEDVTLFQALMVMLAVSGLSIGLLITERTEGERRLRAQQDALARAARLSSMGEFAAAMAHEINQPLTAAGNYARAVSSSLKRTTPRVEDARKAADLLIEQVDRSAQVIRRLRELIRGGRLEVTSESVDRVLRESLDLASAATHTRLVQVDISAPAGLPQVAVDLVQIQQVVTNLIRNAVEALVEADTASPRVVLTARRASETEIEIAVTDNGPGFPDGFVIGDTWTLGSTKVDGLGVGLSLCQSIVAAHGGKLVIENRAAGASVTFRVPVFQQRVSVETAHV